METNKILDYERLLCELNYRNKQLLLSKNYTVGKKINKYISYIKRLDIKGFIKAVLYSSRIKKADKLFNDHVSDTYEHINPPTIELNRIGDYTVTIYTCIVGKYELPKIPMSSYQNYRYVLFTDQEFEQTGCWEVHSIPLSIQKLKSNSEINRYIKFHPADFFDTDYSLYIDGNVELISSINDFVKKINNKTGLAMFDHPERNCLYREGQVCCFLGKGNTKELNNQILKYEEENMPHGFGLKEATVILSDLNNPISSSILSLWWDEYYNSKSGRDQLAFPYIIWKKGLKITDVGSLGSNIRDDLHLNIHYHGV